MLEAHQHSGVWVYNCSGNQQRRSENQNNVPQIINKVPGIKKPCSHSGDQKRRPENQTRRSGSSKISSGTQTPSSRHSCFRSARELGAFRTLLFQRGGHKVTLTFISLVGLSDMPKYRSCAYQKPQLTIDRPQNNTVPSSTLIDHF